MVTNRKMKLLTIVLSTILSGCISAHVNKVEADIQVARMGPKELPKKNITDFSKGLRCMDDLFIVFGASPDDYPMLVENINDKTKKVNAGTRQMIISAIAGMTKRSRAIKLIAFGQDTGNLVAFLSESGSKNPYQSIPAFDIVGSISQLDDGLIKKQADISGETAGTWNERNVGGGTGSSASNSATSLGLDLSVVTSHNMAVLPSATTRNSVVLYTGGSASSFDAGINKVGMTYSISTNRKDPTAQGLRALVELSVIELIGKLAKLPYWHCLGVDPEHEEISNEISDWYYQLNQSQLFHTTLKAQLYLRGYYQGDIDESITEDYQLAVLQYKQRLGLELTPSIDIDFYKAFLNQTPMSIPRNRLAYVNKPKHSLYDFGAPKVINKPGPYVRDRELRYRDKNAPLKIDELPKVEPVKKEEKLELAIYSFDQKEVYQKGDKVNLSVSSTTNGYVNCYFQRGDELIKIFPNRFSTNNFISSKGVIPVPDSNEYSLVAEDFNEQLHCYLTTKNIDSDLPAGVAVEDFTALQNVTLQGVTKAYNVATNGRFATTSYTIEVN